MKFEFVRVTFIAGMGEALVFKHGDLFERHGMISLDKKWIKLHTTDFKWVEMWYGCHENVRAWCCSMPDGRISIVPEAIIKMVDEYVFEKEFLS